MGSGKYRQPFQAVFFAAAKPLSFPVERGAHGGPGRFETDAFALLPPGVTGPAAGEKGYYLRIADLREAVNCFLQS